MCGGTIEFNSGDTIGICDSCGTKQTLPRLDDDKKANLYDRANHFRRNNDFDKAMGIYEQILNEDNTDAEAYWSIVLCRYGIEYVEDPATHKRVPTVNRAQFASIYTDEDYKSALKYADSYQKAIYEEEAKAIDDIQKGILAISSKEEPFDVFICYKETDNSGKRTKDSVLANDLYHQLTQEGFKVFFSRITLEDKLGTAYEPYIFAALNSAKVMVVLGTKPEYFNAVWVKNEWSRYLALIKKGAKKILIPAYRDMDPYDLPDEFSHLQAQDMSKLGFMQDLIRGIKKIVSEKDETHTVTETHTATGNANIEPLLKRAFMFLEDKDFKNANIYCEKVLDQDPENAMAYLGKLMAGMHVSKREQLKDSEESFDDSNNYQKILRFGDDSLKKELTDCIKYINERNEQARLTEIYNETVEDMNSSDSEDELKSIAEEFKKISGFKDADELYQKCLDKAEDCRKDGIYNSAKEKTGIAEQDTGTPYLNDRSKEIHNKISLYEEAINIFENIPGWRDTEEQINICRRKIEELRTEDKEIQSEMERKAEVARIAEKKLEKIIKITVSLSCVGIVILVIMVMVVIPNYRYHEATELLNTGKYSEAVAAFERLGDFKDSQDKYQTAIKELKYQEAEELLEKQSYSKAAKIFRSLGDYKDSQDKYETAIKPKYQKAEELLEKQSYNKAAEIFKSLGDYKDSQDKYQTAIKELKYQEAEELLEKQSYSKAAEIFKSLGDYKDSHDKYKTANSKANEIKAIFKKY